MAPSLKIARAMYITLLEELKADVECPFVAALKADPSAVPPLEHPDYVYKATERHCLAVMILYICLTDETLPEKSRDDTIPEGVVAFLSDEKIEEANWESIYQQAVQLRNGGVTKLLGELPDGFAGSKTREFIDSVFNPQDLLEMNSAIEASSGDIFAFVKDQMLKDGSKLQQMTTKLKDVIHNDPEGSKALVADAWDVISKLQANAPQGSDMAASGGLLGQLLGSSPNGMAEMLTKMARGGK